VPDLAYVAEQGFDRDLPLQGGPGPFVAVTGSVAFDGLIRAAGPLGADPDLADLVASFGALRTLAEGVCASSAQQRFWVRGSVPAGSAVCPEIVFGNASGSTTLDGVFAGVTSTPSDGCITPASRQNVDIVVLVPSNSRDCIRSVPPALEGIRLPEWGAAPPSGP
jgi:hypothetical protein